MKSIVKLISTFGVISFVACAPKVEAERSGDWKLLPSQSTMSYVTIKNAAVGEVNTFGEISGTVTTSGEAEFVIALDSVQTYIDTRDPRMKEFVFETDKFPLAKISTSLNMSQLAILGVGNSKTLTQIMQFDLHGIKHEQEARLKVTRLGANKVQVSTHDPLVLDATDFGFEAGIAKLQELAKLNSISPIVSTTVSLTFER